MDRRHDDCKLAAVADLLAAAEYLSVSHRTLPSWRSLGKGPCYVRVGRAIRYRVEDLHAYLQSRVVETADSTTTVGL
jgi:hypothetical protein